MGLIWGAIVVVSSTLAWAGQMLSWLTPARATRWGLSDNEADVDPSFWADSRGEAIWDSLSLWPMIGAGALLILDYSAWAYFGLIGGGMFVYFAGRGISTRLTMLERGIQIGSPGTVRTAMTALTLWGLTGLITIIAAVVELEG